MSSTPTLPLLDKFQRAFCETEGRALRLLAPAGSGKTHSLLWRCKMQAERAGEDRPKFLIFTFTKTAKEELLYRLSYDAAFAGIRSQIEITTLNSWGWRRLKRAKHSLKLVVSTMDQMTCLHNTLQPVWSKHHAVRDAIASTNAKGRIAKDIITLMDAFKGMGFRHDRHANLESFLNHVESLRRAGLFPYLLTQMSRLQDIGVIESLNAASQLANSENPYAEALKETHENFLRFWCDALPFLYDTSMITLEDQKYWAHLDVDSQFAQRQFLNGAARIHHILVDEFQDVNLLDLELIRSIVNINRATISIVGDDDQAIYEWRGGAPDFIINPDEHIGGNFETHILENNYRSPRNIVALAQKLIVHNHRRVPKRVTAASTADAKIEVFLFGGMTDSISRVLETVRDALSQNPPLSVALISRKRSQIIPYQITFARENIPFYAAEDLHIFLSQAFEDLKGLLEIKIRAGYGPMPGFSLATDLLTLCDKVERYPLTKVERAQLSNHLNAQPRCKTMNDVLDRLLAYRGTLKGSNEDGSRSKKFSEAIRAFLFNKTVSDTLNAISAHFAGLQRDHGKAAEDIFFADPPFLHLAEYAARYGDDLLAFIDDLEKAVSTLVQVSDADEDTLGSSEPPSKTPLHLMTALRAKGKEFDIVILLDVNDGIWPSKMATSAAQREQERRVFYVATTRAKKSLTMLVNKRMLGRIVNPSPYLDEMSLETLNMSDSK